MKEEVLHDCSDRKNKKKSPNLENYQVSKTLNIARNKLDYMK